MTRSQALAALRDAHARGDTRAIHRARIALREATHRVLSKPKWRRWLDGWLA